MTAPSGLVRHRRGLLWALAVVWVGAFVLTHIPAEKIPELYASDKTLHVVGYAAITGLLWLHLAARGGRRLRRIAVTIVALIIYAAVDESTQPLVNRSASVGDWYADCLGIILAIALCEALAWLMSRRDKNRLRA